MTQSETRYGEMKPHEVKGQFTLPFSLIISGESDMALDGHTYRIKISTLSKENTTFPGLEKTKNIFMLNDDTNHFEETTINLSFTHPIPVNATKRNIYALTEMPEFMHKVANRIISLSRIILENFILPPTIDLWQLNPMHFQIFTNGKWENYTCCLSPSGGLRNYRKQIEKHKTLLFTYYLKTGGTLSLDSEILADAKRYLAKMNSRMALMNLCLFFEVSVKGILQLFSDELDKEIPHDDWRNWTLSKSAGKGLKTALGAGLDSKQYYGEMASKTYEIILKQRNNIMHKGLIHFDLFDDINDSSEAQYKRLKTLFEHTEQTISILQQKAMYLKSELTGRIEKNFLDSLSSVFKNTRE